MGPRAALVLLAFLLASASGAYVTSTYNYVVDSSLANSVTNGDSSGRICIACSGQNPRKIGYFKFNLQSLLNGAEPKRFCASSVSLNLNRIGGLAALFAPPATGLNIRVDSLNPNSFGTSLTYNTQPSLEQYIQRSTPASFPATSNAWYQLAMAAESINTQVAELNRPEIGFRFSYGSNSVLLSYEACYETTASNGAYRPYLEFNYAICDPNALCQTGGTCSCMPGYLGNGIQCTIGQCAAETGTGNAVWAATNAGTVATGTCLPTYGGSPKRSCSTSFTWGAVSSPCVKLLCPATNSTNVGFANWPLADAGTRASGVCFTGYSGSPTRACLNNGVWDANAITSCNRIYCSKFTNAFASWETTPSMTSATGTCTAGFTGSATATCTAAGTWTNLVNNCQQIMCPARGDDFDASWPSTAAGSSTMGTCAAGYSGFPIRSCSITGVWASTVTSPCTQLRCPALTGDDHADWPSTVAGISATGTCNAGWTGSPTRSCNINGQWSSTIASPCIQRTCAAETAFNATWSTALSNDLAEGSCVPGFQGTPLRQCGVSGTWASSVTNPCSVIFCGTGTYDDASWPSAPAGTAVVEGTCRPNFSGSPKRSCNIDGTWGDLSSVCTLNVCDAVSETHTSWPSTSASMTATGTCLAGYTGSPTRTCNSDGTWGAVVNPCSNILCDAVSEGNATWASSVAGSVDVAGTCTTGFSGSPSRSCQLDGSWGAVSGSCSQNVCPALSDPDNQASWLSTPGNTQSVLGECDAGTTGFPTRDCLASGDWSEVVQNPCTNLPCPALTRNFNANWPAAGGLDQVVAGVCVAGYAGSPERLCDENGVWSNVITNPCTRITCNATVQGFQHFFASWPASANAGTTVSGACLAGYTGSISRTCSLTGNWGVPSTKCTRITCAAIADDGNHASWPLTGADEVATATCLTGFTGAPTRTCSLTGSWGAVSNPCTRTATYSDLWSLTSAIELRCPAITDAKATWADTAGGESRSGVCISGYVGTPTRACSVDGFWQTIQSSCEPVSCPALSSENLISWPAASAGSIVVGTCSAGYKASPAPTRQCESTGRWGTVASECTRIMCAAVTAGNAEWPASQSMTDNVIGTCVAGYAGRPTRSCSADGIFSDISDACTPLSCPARTVGGSSWTSAVAGQLGLVGTCSPGFVGRPLASCHLNGTWSDVTNPCEPIKCPASVAGNAEWTATTAGSTTSGTCLDGFSGLALRNCSIEGVWDAVPSPCERVTCPARVAANAQWSSATAGTPLVFGQCLSTYAGIPSVSCRSDGTWSPVTSPCEPLSCASAIGGGALWPEALAGTAAQGTCIAGYSGSPTRNCSLSGIYGPIEGSCELKFPDCAREVHGSAYFSTCPPGETMVGRCETGYLERPEGPPTRQCFLNGTWSAHTEHECVFAVGLDSTRVRDLHAVVARATNVTLAWNTVNATLFRVESASGASTSFVTVNSGAGDGVNGTSIVVSGLFAKSKYRFRVFGGDVGKGFDLDAAAIVVETAIMPPTTLFVERGNETSLSFSWFPSADAEFYRVFRKMPPTSGGVEARSSVEGGPEGFEFYMDLPSNTTTLTLNGLEPGASYSLAVYAGAGNETEPTGVILTATTDTPLIDDTPEAIDHCIGIVCPSGATCVNDASTSTGFMCDSYDPNDPYYIGTWLPLVIGVAVVIGLYFIMRHYWPEADNTHVPAVALAIFDVVSDVLFIISIWGSYVPQHIVYVFLFFTIVPILANSTIIGLLYNYGPLNEPPPLRTWAKDHRIAVAASILLGVLNVTSLRVVTSKMLNLRALSCIFDSEFNWRLEVAGLATNVFEDVPQIVLQIYVATILQSFPPVLVMSFLASTAALLFATLKRGIMWMSGSSRGKFRKQEMREATLRREHELAASQGSSIVLL